MREAKFATKTTPTPLGAYLSKSRLLGNRSLPQTTCANNSASSGDLLPPSPPAEKATASKDQARESCIDDGTGDREWGPADRLHHREFGRTGRVGLKLARAVEGVLTKLTGSSEVAEVASRILIEAGDGGCAAVDRQVRLFRNGR